MLFVSQLCMFGLQLGFLSTYLSEPIVKAFTSAAAFHVTISQLQSMLGLRLPRHTGPFSLFKVSSQRSDNDQDKQCSVYSGLELQYVVEL